MVKNPCASIENGLKLFRLAGQHKLTVVVHSSQQLHEIEVVGGNIVYDSHNSPSLRRSGTFYANSIMIPQALAVNTEQVNVHSLKRFFVYIFPRCRAQSHSIHTDVCRQSSIVFHVNEIDF